MKKSLIINLLIVAILIAAPVMASGCMLKIKVTPPSHKIISKKVEKNSMEIFNNMTVAIERAILQNVLFRQSSVKGLLKLDETNFLKIYEKKSLDNIFNSINPKIPMC